MTVSSPTFSALYHFSSINVFLIPFYATIALGGSLDSAGDIL